MRLRYERSWEGSLLAALGVARNEDVRRGVTSVGPQRDDLFLSIEGYGCAHSGFAGRATKPRFGTAPGRSFTGNGPAEL